MTKLIIFLMLLIILVFVVLFLYFYSKLKKAENTAKKTVDKIINYEKELIENEEKAETLNNCATVADFDNSLEILRNLNERGKTRNNK